MNEQIRNTLESLLREAVTTPSKDRAENLLGQAQGILHGLLLAEQISAQTHSAEWILIKLAREQRQQLKGTEK